MNLKKILVGGLSCTLIMSMLVGCSSPKETADSVVSSKQGIVAKYSEYPEYKALDYVTLPDDYKKLTVSVDSIEDEFTDEYVKKQAIAYLAPTVVEDVQMGDTVVINFTGTVDGKEFDGGTAENYSLEIGSGNFIDDFEDQLVGLKVNDTKKVEVTFPSDYATADSGFSDLNGKDAVFDVKINSVNRPAELTDENVQASTDYKNVDEYMTAMRSMLSESVADANTSRVQNAVSTKLVEVCEIKEVPQELIDWYVNNNLASYENAAAQLGASFNDFVAAQTSNTCTDRDSLKEVLMKEAKSSLSIEMILHAIAEDNNISVSDDEYKASIDTYTTQYGATEDELIEYYKVSNLKSTMLVDKALEVVMKDVVTDSVTKTE